MNGTATKQIISSTDNEPDDEYQETSNSRGKWIISAILLIGAIFAGGFYFTKKNKDAKAATATAKTASAISTSAGNNSAAPVEVTTAAAISRGLPQTVEVVGSLTADEEVVVSSQIAGEITALNIDFGSYVQKGQIIAQIDQRDALLRIEQSELQLKQTMARIGMKEGVKFDPLQTPDVMQVKAQLDWTKMDLDRATKLVEAGDVPRTIYDQALTQKNLAQARYQAALDAISQQVAIVEQQRAAINLSRKSLTDTVVRSPISGAVKEKFQARGAFVPVGGKIVSIVRTNPIRLRADIPESSVSAVRVGQTISVTTDAFPNRTFMGRVTRLGTSLSEQTRALPVEAVIANPANTLRPGMFAKSQLVTNRNGSAIMVPTKAIFTIAGIIKVFVIENGKAVEKLVKTGLTDGELIEITEGVNEGDQVATSNLDKLQQGSNVSSK
jgi:RND family efflux transporter MFP subunit